MPFLHGICSIGELKIASMTTKLPLILALSAMILGCSSQRKVAATDITSSTPLIGTAMTDQARPVVASESPADCRQARLSFSSALLSKGARKGENLIVSPLSAGVALSMLREGASGRTLSDLDAALFGASYPLLRERSDSSTILRSANSLWIKEGFSMLRSYEETLKEKYQAQAFERDFSSRATVGEINSWCSRNTAGKIPSILSELKPTDVAVLLNALYFNAPWTKPFMKEGERVFHCASGDKEVPFMDRKDNFPVIEDEMFTSVAVPYEGNGAAMILLLPKEGTSAEDLAGSLDVDKISTILEGTYPTRTELHIPKFKLETTLSMNNLLKEMGAGVIFEPSADFSAMSPKRICVSEVQQKCYLDVSEKGTEAAAVTSITMKLTSVAPSRTTVLVFDRPFVFLLYDYVNEEMLFEGVINNP